MGLKEPESGLHDVLRAAKGDLIEGRQRACEATFGIPAEQ
jgi:hypothetical protein